MVSSSKPWMDWEIELLRSMAAAGLSMATVAKNLGRSRSAVGGAARRLGVGFGRVTFKRDVDDGLRERWIAMLPAMKEALRRNIEATSS
jgi:hypothetical protein